MVVMEIGNGGVSPPTYRGTSYLSTVTSHIACPYLTTTFSMLGGRPTGRPNVCPPFLLRAIFCSVGDGRGLLNGAIVYTIRSNWWVVVVVVVVMGISQANECMQCSKEQ